MSESGGPPAASIATSTAAQAARESYGRLLSLVASCSGDLAGAEDALSDAFAAALTQWPLHGVPDKPLAWLLTVARHRQLDVARSAATRTRVDLADEEFEALFLENTDLDEIPDQRLKLLFVCAHPAIDAAVRAPLMMQTVLGLEAQDIARAFLVPTATMAQRLVRAKRKIKHARVAFALPSRSDMPERLEAVLEAVYGAYAIGWDLAGEAVTQEALNDEPAQAEAIARGTSQVKAPAMTGPESFERLVRVHLNTQERLVLMLPLMATAAHFWNPQWRCRECCFCSGATPTGRAT